MDNLGKYKKLIENIPAVTWISDQAGNTVFISPGVIDLYGYTPDEVQKTDLQGWLRKIHELDRHRALRAYNELFSDGRPFDITYRIKHKQGHWLWLHDQALATFKEDGITYAYGMSIDVTEQKEVELALREQKQRFETLVSSSTDWIWEFDENEIFTYSSPRIKELLGYEADEVIGLSAFDLIPPEEAKQVQAEFQPVKEARLPFSNLHNINQHKDGHLVTIESSGVPIIDEDGVFHGYRGIDRDISERQKLEAQLRHMQKMDAMGTLAGGIAHDFNNILAVMLGYAEMLKKDVAVNDKGQRHLAEVLKAGQRAKSLVSQILSFSRVIEQERRPLQLHLLVKEVEHFLRATIPSTIQIIQQFETEDDIILADPTQIHQVIMNLSTNAAHAMAENGGNLAFRIFTEQIDQTDSLTLPAGNYVKFQVSDTGGGIAEEHLSRMFDPYFTTKAIGEGAGLGLSVVHGIVQSHDGEIRVINHPGKGATFEITFPLIESQPLLEPVENQIITLGSGHILLVDDEQGLVALGAEMLREKGYQVTTETNSLAALERFAANPEAYDLVVTDQTMPNLTGDQLASRLLKIRPDLPIILCTGYSSKIDQQQALAIGIQEFLQKPVEIAQLTAAISRALNLKPSS